MKEICSTPVLTLLVNGKEQAVESPATLAALIALRDPRPPFAVELNRRLVRRGEYETVALHDGDIVEIVTLVGGG